MQDMTFRISKKDNKNMSKKNQLTACSPLPWSQIIKLINDLKKNKNYRFALLIALGAYSGLRISDILKLRWTQIINSEILDLQEKKTGKIRRIYLNQNLQKIIGFVYKKMKDKNSDITALENYVFLNRFKTKAISIQYVDRMLPVLLFQSGIKCENTGSHLLRKSFGKKIFENNGSSESSLILLSDLFNHSSIKITRKYIGLEAQQFQAAYMGLE
jgi:integrase